MSLSLEMTEFCNAWLAKADSYEGGELNDYYNKSFSLFTLYNRLYAEATFTLAREGQIVLLNDKPFPDGKGAKEYAPKFIGYEHLLQILNNDINCNTAITDIIRLIENEEFYIKLSMPHGNRQKEKDQLLLQALKSTGAKTKITAVLDLIYSVRCNMFHGNKGFEPVQIRLLNPMTVILRKIVETLFEKLQNN